jgi:D-sedoheptulose 7-phosphate isomerase
MQFPPMQFPNEPVAAAGDFAERYIAALTDAARTLDAPAIAAAAKLICETIDRGGTIYACGNGGSGAIANHLLCDFAKGIQTDTALRPRVVSLSAHTELMLAIGNDIDFAEIFAYQLRSWGRNGDLLLAISSSGNSENIVRAVDWARDNGIATIAFTGFDGGRVRSLARVNIHVAAGNYGIVEDLHQSCMHLLAQYIRQSYMPPDLVAERKF